MSAYYGGGVDNGYGFIVAEFISRQNLRKLGYFDPIGSLDDFTYKAFMVIDSEFKRLDNLEMRKNGAKN